MLDSRHDLVSVALPVPLARHFDYRLPEGVDMPLVGVRVSVPFGKRSLTGLVVGTASALPTVQYKALHRVLDAKPLAPPEWLASLRWAAGYYQQPLGEVIAAALPAPLREAATARRALATVLSLTPSGEAALANPKRRAKALREGLMWLADGPQPRQAGRAPPAV